MKVVKKQYLANWSKQWGVLFLMKSLEEESTYGSEYEVLFL